MSGTCKNGFTLLEIIIVVAVIGLLMTVAIPTLWRRSPADERKQLIAQLNAFTRHTWYQAVTTGKTHQLLFDFTNKRIAILRETDKVNDSGDLMFEPIKQSYVPNSFNWPSHYQIKQFIIEGVDMLEKYQGGKTNELWFFIVPEGIAQAVIINMLDTNDIVRKKPRPIGLVLNPFSAEFKEYDTFQK